VERGTIANLRDDCLLWINSPSRLHIFIRSVFLSVMFIVLNVDIFFVHVTLS
jgi:hypothetical protein